MVNRRKIALLLLLISLVVSACNKSEPANNDTTIYGAIGIILPGTLEQYGWGNADIQSENYATTTISGHTVMIYFFLVDQPATSFVETLINQGARAIFVSPGINLAPSEIQRPDVVFVYNRVERADVERILPTLNLTITLPSAPQAKIETTNPALVTVMIIVVVVVIVVMSQIVKRSIGGAVSADPPSTVIERIVDRVQFGETADKRKKKRPNLANASVHGKAVRIQDRVEGRKTDFAALGQPHPLVHKLTTYVQGYKHYDMSFAIETAKDEFLGECGIGLCSTLPYDRDKGVAFEIWLFDKQDANTDSQVVGSVLAVSDETMQKTLKNKGLVDLIEPDTYWTLQTKTLRLQARIVDVEYAYHTSDLPPQSTFEHVVFELAVWRK